MIRGSGESTFRSGSATLAYSTKKNLLRDLDSLGERLELVGGELYGGRALGDERDDGDAGVAAHHRAVHPSRVQALQVS